MSAYAGDHAGALADIRQAGAPVVFTSVAPGTYDSATDTHSPATETAVAGHAIEVTPRGTEAEEYRGLTLTASSHRLLLCVAETLGEVPEPGWRCTWAGAAYTVRALLGSVAPDGVPVLFRAVVAA